MTTTSLITMIVILGFVWGGFLLLLTTALRKESRKAPDTDHSPRSPVS